MNAPEQTRPRDGVGIVLKQNSLCKGAVVFHLRPGVSVVDAGDFEGGQPAAGAKRPKASVVIGTEPVEQDRDVHHSRTTGLRLQCCRRSKAAKRRWP